MPQPNSALPSTRPAVVHQLASLVIEQSQLLGNLVIEAEAIPDAAHQYAALYVRDATETEIKAATQEVVRRVNDVTIRVALDDGSEREEVVFSAADVLKHHGESRTWPELTLDESHQHLQMSLAEDYALLAFRRQHGNFDDIEATVLTGLTGISTDADDSSGQQDRVRGALRERA